VSYTQCLENDNDTVQPIWGADTVFLEIIGT
jgi:hypothetical protein